MSSDCNCLHDLFTRDVRDVWDYHGRTYFFGSASAHLPAFEMVGNSSTGQYSTYSMHVEGETKENVQPYSGC
jgi:hypothetical protein